MDLLFKEYASPFPLLDELIRNKRLCDFLTTFEEQRDERLLWEFYLHKVPMWEDMSFDEFKEKAIKKPQQIQTVPEEQLETITAESIGILSGFVPE